MGDIAAPEEISEPGLNSLPKRVLFPIPSLCGGGADCREFCRQVWSLRQINHLRDLVPHLEAHSSQFFASLITNLSRTRLQGERLSR